MGRIGYKHTPEALEKIRLASLGRKLTDEQKKKIGEGNRISLKGNVPWNKGKNGVYSKETLKEMALAKIGSKGYWKGKKRTLKDRQKMSKNRIGLTAKENHPNWKGGVTPINHLIRNSFEYKEWRRVVFARDNWTCVWCRYRSCRKIKGRSDIEADHIKPFVDYPELRLAIDNGRTLCVECHKKVTYKKL